MKNTTMLKKNYEFKTVLTRGKCFREKEIEIFIIKTNKKRNFLGIAISTKNGKAFQRNKLKRIIRECYRRLEGSITEGNSIVILVNKKSDIKNIKFSNVLEQMDKIFKIANISKKEEWKWRKYLYI